MTTTKIEKVIAFLFGDIFVTGFVGIGGILTEVTHFGLKVVSVIVLGIAGGFAGLAGKDLYNIIKRKTK